MQEMLTKLYTKFSRLPVK